MWLAYFVNPKGKVENIGLETTEEIAFERCERALGKNTDNFFRVEKVEGDPQLRFCLFSIKVEDEPDGYLWSGRMGVVTKTSVLGWYGVMKLERMSFRDALRPELPVTVPTPAPRPAVLTPAPDKWHSFCRGVPPVRLSPSISESAKLGVKGLGLGLGLSPDFGPINEDAELRSPIFSQSDSEEESDGLIESEDEMCEADIRRLCRGGISLSQVMPNVVRRRRPMTPAPSQFPPELIHEIEEKIRDRKLKTEQ
jgi:hypothetical protein